MYQNLNKPDNKDARIEKSTMMYSEQFKWAVPLGNSKLHQHEYIRGKALKY